MSLIFVLALGLTAYLLWRSSAPIRAGAWRVGAGLGALVLIASGAALAIRGDPWIGLPLAGGGLVAALAGRANRKGPISRPSVSEDMSPAEARAILGVTDSASAQDIKAAYARLMKRVHPDQGGSSGLAAKLNAARDRLLRKR